MSAAAPFAALAALAREEYAMVCEDRFDELEGLRARREDVMALLPRSAPAEALGDLREAARIQALVTTALRVARDATAAELVQVRRTRKGAQGYAAGTGVAPPRSSFDQSR
jgi:hypothetical protein